MLFITFKTLSIIGTCVNVNHAIKLVRPKASLRLCRGSKAECAAAWRPAYHEHEATVG